MRLNERSLAEFSTSSAPTDKEGYLSKKGEVNRGYQRRWFVLKGNLLYYFERRSDKEPIGVIILDNCHVELAESGEPYAFQINFGGDGVRTYILGADTPQEMEAWMRALTHANYEYISMMVSEFEADLRRLSPEEDELVGNNNVGSGFAAKEGTSDSSLSTTSQKDNRDRAERAESPFNPAAWQTDGPRTSPHPRTSQSSPPPLLIDFDSDDVTGNQDDFSLNAAFSSVSRLSDDLMHVSFPELERLEELHSEDQLIHLGGSKFYGRDSEVLAAPQNPTVNNVKLTRQPRWKSERRKNIVRSGMESLEFPPRANSLGRSGFLDTDLQSGSESVFRRLHNQYGASIWVKVKEYGKQDILK